MFRGEINTGNYPFNLGDLKLEEVNPSRLRLEKVYGGVPHHKLKLQTRNLVREGAHKNIPVTVYK
jgi:hypothetical protein